jgi:hypothetical protein
MGKDQFLLQSNKENIVPFFPIACYPDHANQEKYQVLLSKQKEISSKV